MPPSKRLLPPPTLNVLPPRVFKKNGKNNRNNSPLFKTQGPIVLPPKIVSSRKPEGSSSAPPPHKIRPKSLFCGYFEHESHFLVLRCADAKDSHKKVLFSHIKGVFVNAEQCFLSKKQDIPRMEKVYPKNFVARRFDRSYFHFRKRLCLPPYKYRSWAFIPNTNSQVKP